ncbi:methyl-accepting chemotaxis protein [Rhodobacteraceae bacterium DSL-40]|uniref:methyl-accepting chemotaxis protein n=1 Tax=Amaricoccus sp. B4 TaxID=3368557 RepID=UPI0013A6D6D7
MFENLSAGRKILAVFSVFAILVFASGGLILWSADGVARNGIRVGEGLAPLGDAVMEVKLTGTFAHMRLEEIISGEVVGNFDSISEQLEAARLFAHAILDGADLPEGRYQPTDSPAVRESVDAALAALDTMEKAARHRLELFSADDGVGSAADATFDELYGRVTDGMTSAAEVAPGNAELQRLVGEARFLIADGHLIVEEGLSGDASADFGMATADFENARARLEEAAALDPAFETAASSLPADVAAFSALALERRANMAARAEAMGAAASALDAAYDQFMSAADDAEDQIHAAMEEGLSALRARDRFAAGMAIAAALVILGAAFIAYRGLHQSIGVRLLQISETMRRLLAGDLDAQAPAWRSADEIGLLRDSVDELREALLRQKALEREAAGERQAAERQRALAEEQRTRAESERAAAETERLRADSDRALAERRAAAAEAFGVEFGAVVARAAEGEFDRRITARFDDPHLEELARGMNRLMDEVERGVADASRVMAQLAGGDLSCRMDGNYKGRFAALKRDVDVTVNEFERIVQAIGETTVAIITDTRRISENSGQLADRATAQAASLEQTSATMTEMAATVKANAESAEQVASRAQRAVETAGKGGEVVHEAINAMSQIDANSRQVGEFVKVINEISFQTNLLALNAGVEAARAGDAGKGFAVVAQEVRALAQRAEAAAGDIGRLMESSTADVAEGVRLVSATGEVLSTIVDAIESVASIADEITIANREQATGIEGVSAAVNELDTITQQNAGMADESAQAAQALTGETERLESLVAFFGGVRGAGTPRGRGRRAA